MEFLSLKTSNDFSEKLGFTLSPPTRDICKFCRGTLSFSLSSDDSWLNGALNKFLELQKISMVQNFEVSIVGYSMCPTSKERR